MIVVKCCHCNVVIRTVQTDNDEKDGQGVSHGICRKCLKENYPDIYEAKYGGKKR